MVRSLAMTLCELRRGVKCRLLAGDVFKKIWHALCSSIEELFINIGNVMASEGLIRNLLSDNNTSTKLLPKISQKGESPFGDFISKISNREKNESRSEDRQKLNNTTNAKSSEHNTPKTKSLDSKKENNPKEEVKRSLQEANESIKSEEKVSKESFELSIDDEGFAEEVAYCVEEELEVIGQEVVLKEEFEADMIKPEDLQGGYQVQNFVNHVTKDDLQFVTNNTQQDQDQIVPIVSENIVIDSALIKDNKIEINLNNEKGITLSQEEQTILLQMEKALSDSKLVRPQSDLIKNNAVQVGDMSSQKLIISSEASVGLQEQVISGEVSVIMADESEQGAEILENILRNNFASSEEIAKSNPKYQEKTQLENMPKVVVEFKNSGVDKHEVTEEIVVPKDLQIAQDSQDGSNMSFENELQVFTNFVKTDSVSQKIDVSFDEFIATNKSASIMKPEQQMTMSLKHAISQGKSEVSISLYPRSLGHVDIKIEFASTPSGQNEVQKVVITADRASTLKIFENTKIQLETALAELKKEAATTVTETNKKETSLEFEMRNGNGGEKNESYFGSFEERENWMNKFQNLTSLDQNDEIVTEANIGERAINRPHYITSSSVDIEV